MNKNVIYAVLLLLEPITEIDTDMPQRGANAQSKMRYIV